MGLSVYFDTYAFCEVVKGNKNYEKFKEGYSITTTRFNLMEFFYSLLSTLGEEIASNGYNSFLDFCIEIDDETIKDAMKFRFANKSKRLSYVDCIGYIIAVKNNILFVTGDEQFRNMPNVEFIK